MLANRITALRVGLVFVGIAFLYTYTVWGGLLAFTLVLIAIMLDGLDGYLARRTQTETPFGAVMDILGDRIVENVLWIVFAHLALVPVWVPIVVVVRGFATDAFRSIALTQGQTAFGEKTMIRSQLGRLLVTSQTSRIFYAVVKVVAFCYLILYFTLLQCSSTSPWGTWRAGQEPLLEWIGLGLVYVTVAFCLVRAAPVIQDGIAQVKQLNMGRR